MSSLPPSSLATPWFKAGLLLILFFATCQPLAVLCRRLLPQTPWAPQAATKLTLLVLSVALALTIGLDAGALGFRAPSAGTFAPGILVGLGLGATATLAVLFSGSAGIFPALRGFSFPQIVVWVWLISSIVEEVFCRGVFQAWATFDGRASGINVLLASACLFAAMHLTLIFVGVALRTIAVLLPMLVALGVLTAWCRAESGSLYPAIAAHIAFNVGGAFGGALYVVFTGRVPGAPQA